MGSRSKYRGPWWPYGRASAETRADQRAQWPAIPRRLRIAAKRWARRINRSRRDREAKLLGGSDDG